MRYSIEPNYRIYVKSYGFLSFAKSIIKNLNNKCNQKLLDSARESGATKVARDAINTASNTAIKNGRSRKHRT